MKRRREFLAFSPPCIGDEEIAAVEECLRAGWLTTGARVHEFEAAFRAYVGAPAALALSSCTAALHLALVAHGVGRDDEVITTTMTFAATANVVENLGARPVFVDVERDTLNIDPDAVAEAISGRTKAVVAVHYGGHPADLDRLQRVCSDAGIPLVEDAAHAVGAAYRGRRIGAASNLAAFSFYATKNMTTGEGGMLTGPEELIERVRPLALHGLSRDAWKRYGRQGNWRYDVVAPGFKYNMPDPAAAMGLVQLRRLDAMQQRRESIAAAYNRGFEPLPSVETPQVREGVTSAHHLYPVRLRPGEGRVGRDEFIAGMTERNIGTSVHFIPLHLQPYYRDRYGYAAESFPVALSEFHRLVSLPLHPGLADDDVRDVIAAARDVLTPGGE